MRLLHSPHVILTLPHYLLNPVTHLNLSFTCLIGLTCSTPQVLQEAVSRYPHLHIITNTGAVTSSGVAARDSEVGLLGIYDDVMHLAQVCCPLLRASY